MRTIGALRTLAITSVLFLGISGAGCAGDEGASEKGETPGVEAEAAEQPAEATEAAAEETPSAEDEASEEASEAEQE
jgi:hypothetical protein